MFCFSSQIYKTILGCVLGYGKRETINRPNSKCSWQNIYKYTYQYTVVPAKSDSDVVLCLQLLSKTLTYTLHLSSRESRGHLCINPILRIGLINK